MFGNRVVVSTRPTAEAPVKILLPIKISENDFETQQWTMLDPHTILGYLWNDVKLRVPTEEVREFWSHARAHKEPWAMSHPASDLHVPIGLYGDSAKISTAFNSDKVLGVFMSLPLWRPRKIRTSRFLLFAIEESKLWGRHTLDSVLARVTWSVNCLFEGMRPSKDLYGKEMPQAALFDGWICKDRTRFAVTELRGDQLWQKTLFRFTASWVWTSARVCHACDARAHGPGSENRLYWQFESWLPEEFSNEQFLARRMPSRGLCISVKPWISCVVNRDGC